MVNIKVKLYSSIKDRGIGLIGKTKAEPVMFLTRFGIHTLGLKFPVDVIVLDNDDKVVKLKESLKPNSFFVWPIRYNKVIELPEAEIKRLRIKIGSKIRTTGRA